MESTWSLRFLHHPYPTAVGLILRTVSRYSYQYRYHWWINAGPTFSP